VDNDIVHLQLALDLSAKGVGLVSPNPLVGCVIVSASGEVVGEGTYLRDNVTHAEVIALEQAGTKAKGGTAYVSLEPHDHQGRTAPCTEALINAGISRVVCPIEDPNPLVSGKGFERLRSADIDVSVGLLADEASRLNEKFICWHKKDRPFVHLKLAMSLDGRISLTNSVSTAHSGETARGRVQEIRHEHDAILVGAATAAVDDPSLTDRSGLPRRRPLARIILDDQLRLPAHGTLSQTTDEAPTMVFTGSTDKDAIANLSARGVQVIPIDGGARNLPSVLSELKGLEIQSVLVEGGSAVAGSFVEARLVDKVTFIYSPIIIGGTAAPVAISGKGASALSDALQLTNVNTRFLDQDIEITGYPAE
jgi:diaminohydroxyphosphoribosylaminopyrimidine deaminase/5-amino-6-(5-phosphoribosylamino)uracil reductase